MPKRQSKPAEKALQDPVSHSRCREVDLFKSKLKLARKPGHKPPPGVYAFHTERIALKMPSDLSYLDEVLDFLCGRMLEFGIVQPGDSEVLVALDEAIVNAVKHGNKSDPRKAVHILAEMNAEGASFTVRDEGGGFVRSDVPDPTDPCRLLEPCGRGILLISHIMDEVCYNELGNEIRMVKKTGPNNGPAPDDGKA
ncbi:MAG TPA: ATP-binding protein [Blastocatellia bacterium]|nr:ATP-binding protein [Blastocatellia bacterium]